MPDQILKIPTQQPPDDSDLPSTPGGTAYTAPAQAQDPDQHFIERFINAGLGAAASGGIGALRGGPWPLKVGAVLGGLAGWGNDKISGSTFGNAADTLLTASGVGPKFLNSYAQALIPQTISAGYDVANSADRMGEATAQIPGLLMAGASPLVMQKIANKVNNRGINASVKALEEARAFDNVFDETGNAIGVKDASKSKVQAVRDARATTIKLDRSLERLGREPKRVTQTITKDVSAPVDYAAKIAALESKIQTDPSDMKSLEVKLRQARADGNKALEKELVNQLSVPLKRSLEGNPITPEEIQSIRSGNERINSQIAALKKLQERQDLAGTPKPETLQINARNPKYKDLEQRVLKLKNQLEKRNNRLDPNFNPNKGGVDTELYKARKEASPEQFVMNAAYDDYRNGHIHNQSNKRDAAAAKIREFRRKNPDSLAPQRAFLQPLLTEIAPQNAKAAFSEGRHLNSGEAEKAIEKAFKINENVLQDIFGGDAAKVQEVKRTFMALPEAIRRGEARFKVQVGGTTGSSGMRVGLDSLTQILDPDAMTNLIFHNGFDKNGKPTAALRAIQALGSDDPQMRQYLSSPGVLSRLTNTIIAGARNKPEEPVVVKTSQ